MKTPEDHLGHEHEARSPDRGRWWRGAAGGGFVAAVASIAAYVESGLGPALVTAGVAVAALALVLLLLWRAGR